jgi:hypothetical protein
VGLQDSGMSVLTSVYYKEGQLTVNLLSFIGNFLPPAENHFPSLSFRCIFASSNTNNKAK